MHGSKAPGGTKRPLALPHLPVGPKPKILAVHMDHPESMIQIFPKLFTVIVIMIQMKFTAYSFLVKYRRQAGLKSISWRAETLPPSNFMSCAGRVASIACSRTICKHAFRSFH